MNCDSKRLLNIGMLLSVERDRNKLFDLIIETAMDFTGSDGGTLYIVEGDTLKFKNMITKSLGVRKGGNGELIDLPPVPLKEGNVCAYAAIHRKCFNFADVYETDEFDFSGPKKYDELTGYRTKSMLVIPMTDDRDRIIGVIQLINATNENGEVIPFESDSELVIKSLASQTAVTLNNINYASEIEEVLNSFIRAITAMVDARTPYNANHSTHMAKCAENFLDYLSETEDEWSFSEEKKKSFLMAVMLHDIGKMVIPLYVMNKETRLGDHLNDIEVRFREIDLINRLMYAEGKLVKHDFEKRACFYKDSLEFIKECNTAGFLSDETLERIDMISSQKYTDENGKEHLLLTKEELECLKIKKGTLLDKERRQMENHVIMTSRFLDEIALFGEYKIVREWAANHHEYLDGTGYPNGLSGEQISKEVRLITILDIFDSLTASDRPYKPAVPLEKALNILKSMADEGKLDNDILSKFINSKAWE